MHHDGSTISYTKYRASELLNYKDRDSAACHLSNNLIKFLNDDRSEPHSRGAQQPATAG